MYLTFVNSNDATHTCWSPGGPAGLYAALGQQPASIERQAELQCTSLSCAAWHACNTCAVFVAAEQSVAYAALPAYPAAAGR